ncbi:hypothetical protein SARC_00343, partial [Sphaeroforma arctica JP610]
ELLILRCIRALASVGREEGRPLSGNHRARKEIQSSRQIADALKWLLRVALPPDVELHEIVYTTAPTPCCHGAHTQAHDTRRDVYVLRPREDTCTRITSALCIRRALGIEFEENEPDCEIKEIEPEGVGSASTSDMANDNESHRESAELLSKVEVDKALDEEADSDEEHNTLDLSGSVDKATKNVEAAGAGKDPIHNSEDSDSDQLPCLYSTPETPIQGFKMKEHAHSKAKPKRKRAKRRTFIRVPPSVDQFMVGNRHEKRARQATATFEHFLGEPLDWAVLRSSPENCTPDTDASGGKVRALPKSTEKVVKPTPFSDNGPTNLQKDKGILHKSQNTMADPVDSLPPLGFLDFDDTSQGLPPLSATLSSSSREYVEAVGLGTAKGITPPLHSSKKDESIVQHGSVDRAINHSIAQEDAAKNRLINPVQKSTRTLSSHSPVQKLHTQPDTAAIEKPTLCSTQLDFSGRCESSENVEILALLQNTKTQDKHMQGDPYTTSALPDKLPTLPLIPR